LEFVKACQAAGGDCTVTGQASFEESATAEQAGSEAVALLLEYPKTNCVWGPYDAAMDPMLEAMQEAGLANPKKLLAVSFDANVADLTEMRGTTPLERVDLGLPLEWIGYAQIDTLSRLFDGQQPVNEGIYTKIITPTNVNKSGAWTGDIPLSQIWSLYKKLWGKG
jgi:ABC-type sugar transport system substrate-binding protein